MNVIIYGIKNCDTMKKAFKWLEAHNTDFTFYDYKKQGADEDILTTAIDQHGWENVINRRGTTWRKLPDDVKENMDAKSAIKVALENPSIIKRPLLVQNDETHLGFQEELYERILK